MEYDFSEKVVLVTGASSGIGEATAIMFAKSGAKLALVGRDEDRLQDVAERCRAQRGEDTLAILADLATDEGCERVVKETLEHFSRLDVLVNNAGITARTCLQVADMATFDEVFNTDVRGVYNVTRLAMRALVEARGSVVNVSSIAATVVAVGSLPYGMAKAALDHFTRLTSLELAPKGVRVNAVSPGITRSRILPRAVKYSELEYETWLNGASSRVPMGRVCEGEDVGRAVLFLASEQASLITGVVLPVDGGLRFGDLATYATEQMQ